MTMLEFFSQFQVGTMQDFPHKDATFYLNECILKFLKKAIEWIAPRQKTDC